MSYYSIVHGRSLELGNKGVLRVHLDQKVRWWTWRGWGRFCRLGLGVAIAALEVSWLGILAVGEAVGAGKQLGLLWGEGGTRVLGANGENKVVNLLHLSRLGWKSFTLSEDRTEIVAMVVE